MDWEVQRDPYGGDPESAVPTWATRRRNLPRLGLVDARLNLAGDQIVLQLVAPRLIDESSDQLRSRLLPRPDAEPHDGQRGRPAPHHSD